MALNTVTIAPNDLYQVLLDAWDAQMNHGFIQALMIHGQPGTGKTKTVEKLARIVGAKLYDFRLASKDTPDVRGLPYYCHDTKTTKWYTPEDIPLHETQPSIWFMDEVTAAEQHLQPLIYGVLQERTLAGVPLPKNCFIVGAGNLVDDGAIAYEMNTALSDRFTHLHVVQSVDSFLENAIAENYDPAVIATIKAHPNLLHTITEALDNGDVIATTGRSWEYVSHQRRTIKNPRSQMIMITGRIGSVAAESFFKVAKNIDDAVSVVDLFKTNREDRFKLYPATLDGLNGIIFGTIGMFNLESLETALEIITDIALLAELRPETPDFQTIMLAELATFGTEALMKKAIADFPKALAMLGSSPAYERHYSRRVADGVAARIA